MLETGTVAGRVVGRFRVRVRVRVFSFIDVKKILGFF